MEESEIFYPFDGHVAWFFHLVLALWHRDFHLKIKIIFLIFDLEKILLCDQINFLKSTLDFKNFYYLQPRN